MIKDSKTPDNLPFDDRPETTVSKITVEKKVEKRDEEEAGPIIGRVIISIVILVILAAIVIGIVKLVPAAIFSLSKVNTSFSSLFSPKQKTSITPTLTSTSSKVTYKVSTSSTPTSYRHTTPVTSHYSNPPAYPTVSGTADLVVHITAIGVRDRSTGVFRSTLNPSTSDRLSVLFQIQNIGTAPSGPWDLRAVMPAINFADQTKYLYNNPSIPAGVAITGELYADQIQSGNHMVQLSIDPSNRLAELRKDNNTDQATINVNGSNSSYYGGTTNGVDLTVRILDINRLSNSSAEARFQVTNQGSQASGSWDYRMEISDADILQNENNNSSLTPGQSRIFTHTFDGLNRNDNNTLEITVDPRDRINESNEDNNTDSEDINL